MTNPGKYFSGEARGSSFLNVLGRLFLNPHPFVWLNSSNQKTYILDLFFFWKAWVVLAWEFCDCKSELASFTHGLLLHVVFLWITACQCASIKWKIGAKTSDVHKVRMPPALPWIMHIWLLIVLVIPPSECQLDHNSKHPLIQTCSIPLSNPEQYHLHTHTRSSNPMGIYSGKYWIYHHKWNHATDCEEALTFGSHVHKSFRCISSIKGTTFTRSYGSDHPSHCEWESEML